MLAPKDRLAIRKSSAPNQCPPGSRKNSAMVDKEPSTQNNCISCLRRCE